MQATFSAFVCLTSIWVCNDSASFHLDTSVKNPGWSLKYSNTGTFPTILNVLGSLDGSSASSVDSSVADGVVNELKT